MKRLAQPGDVTLFEAAVRVEQALVLVDVLERRGAALREQLLACCRQDTETLVRLVTFFEAG